MTGICDVSLLDVQSERSVQAGRFERTPGVLLVLTDEAGVQGVGEASPLSGYSPDDISDTRRALARLEPGELTSNLAGVAGDSTVARLSALTRSLDEALPAAHFALETAYLDLSCRQDGVPANSLLPSLEHGSISVAALLPTLDHQSVDHARRLISEGYSTLKVKLRSAAPEQLDLLTQVSRLGARLRVDANRGLDAREARDIAPRLAMLGVEFIEEPCPGCSAHDLGEASLDLALDESLQGIAPAALGPLLDRTGARVVVLKPMALGGVVRCLRLAGEARKKGVASVVSHTFDGPVALHAAALLALSLQSRTLAAGLAAHPGLEQWPSSPSPFARPGVLEARAFERPWLSPHEVLGRQG